MRIAIAILLFVHALIHVMGLLKAFELAKLPQFTLPISKPLGVAWLLAMLLLAVAAGVLIAAPRWFWLVGGLGIALSQFVIITSWHDAKFGTILNVVLLVAVVHSAFWRGPFGLRWQYETAVSRALTGASSTSLVTEADLAPLPLPVQRYLRLVGVVGQPRVQNFRVRFSGRIRSAENSPWMEFTAQQLSLTEPAARLFMMDAKMKGLAVDVFHSYVNNQARMQVKVLSVYPMVDAGGFGFTTGETVTLFNDLCVMAPAALIHAAIKWRPIDDRTVEGTFSNAGHTIRAVLYFDSAGALVNFTSDDRPSLGPDGRTFVPQRWSTPLTKYRAFGALHLASHGDARYAAKSGDFTYGEFDIEEVTYNVLP